MAISEEWRWVVGYEGLYMVSDQGRVFGLPKPTHYGHVLAKKTHASGYESVCLCRGNHKRYVSVHRIVAAAFVPNPNGKPEVNHKNGIRSDNRASNLEWVTRSENERHAYHVLGKSPNRPWAGKPRKSARLLSDEQVRMIRADVRPSRDIGRLYGVSKTTILNVKNRKLYSEVV